MRIALLARDSRVFVGENTAAYTIPAGWQSVTVGTPISDPANGLASNPDAVTGIICVWGNLSGLDSVTVNDDLSYSFVETTAGAGGSFDYYFIDPATGDIGATGTETIPAAPVVKNHTATGGISISGTAQLDKLKAFISSGTIVLAGAAINSKVKNAIANGAIAIGGQAVTGMLGNNSMEATGGVILTGAATTSKIKNATGTAAIALSGNATTAIFSSMGYVASGGITLAGAAATTKIKAALTAGGISVTGIGNYSFTPSPSVGAPPPASNATYITRVQLAESPGARELAQVASPQHKALIAYDLMDASLRGDARGSWTNAELQIADTALLKIESAVMTAEALINGYLVKRGYTVPVAPVPDIVTTWARAITRYTLHKDRIADEKSDPIVRDYKDAIAFLKQVAKGEFTLGIGDPVATSPAAVDVRFENSGSVFSRDNLRKYF